jgi:hypothetical protein
LNKAIVPGSPAQLFVAGEQAPGTLKKIRPKGIEADRKEPLFRPAIGIFVRG